MLFSPLLAYFLRIQRGVRNASPHSVIAGRRTLDIVWMCAEITHSTAYHEGFGWKKTALPHVCLTGMQDICRCVFCGPLRLTVYFTPKCGNLPLTQVHTHSALHNVSQNPQDKKQHRNDSLTSCPSLKCYIAWASVLTSMGPNGM